MYLKNEDKQLIVDTLKQEIPELQAIYLFGSYRDGTATSKSDIDIAYLTTVKLSSLERWDESQKLALLLSHDVDLIELSETNTIFRYQILSTGNVFMVRGMKWRTLRHWHIAFIFVFRKSVSL